MWQPWLPSHIPTRAPCQLILKTPSLAPLDVQGYNCSVLEQFVHLTLSLSRGGFAVLGCFLCPVHVILLNFMLAKLNSAHVHSITCEVVPTFASRVGLSTLNLRTNRPRDAGNGQKSSPFYFRTLDFGGDFRIQSLERPRNETRPLPKYLRMICIETSRPHEASMDV